MRTYRRDSDKFLRSKSGRLRGSGIGWRLSRARAELVTCAGVRGRSRASSSSSMSSPEGSDSEPTEPSVSSLPPSCMFSGSVASISLSISSWSSSAIIDDISPSAEKRSPNSPDKANVPVENAGANDFPLSIPPEPVQSSASRRSLHCTSGAAVTMIRGMLSDSNACRFQQGQHQRRMPPW
jgi:hypothetical protein